MTFLENAGWMTFFVLFVCAMIVLYLARKPAHRAIRGLLDGLYIATRFVARSLANTATKMHARNREVLLHLGREQSERELRKEFHEISSFVQRDLGGYPKLQQNIREEINLIQADYEASQHTATELPDWTQAVESVAKLKTSNSEANTRLLEQIHSTAEIQHRENLKAYRETNSKRNTVLQKVLPHWRKLSFSIDDTGRRLSDIVERSKKIDKQMERFNDIQTGSERAEHMLRSSAITQFLISALVITIAIGGAFFNFHLIALPMSEMVGSAQRIGGAKVSDLAALVIICMEISAGIFLLESLRITKLFPLIGSMDDRTRRTIMIASASVLLTLASTESALAFMRDQIANDLAALRASLAGPSSFAEAEVHTGINHWIPLAANMVLGFVLPLALTMIAIPLEYLLQSGRTVLGSVVASLIGLLAIAVRVFASLLRQMGHVLTSFYDLLIAGPLFIESLVLKSRSSHSDDVQEELPWDDVEPTEPMSTGAKK